MVKLYVPYFNTKSSKSNSVTIELIKKSVDGNNFRLIESEDQKVNIENAGEKFVNVINNIYNFDNAFKKIEKKMFINKRLTLQSFSSINRFSKSNEMINVANSMIFESEKEHDESRSFLDLKESNELPGGTNVGLMFHKIFEEIDFAIINKYKTGTYKNLAEEKLVSLLVEQCFDIYMKIHLKKDEAKELYLGEIYKIIFNALNTPIIGDFCLSDLSREDKIHEVEFYYPVDPILINDNVNLEAFINGFIDMVFKFDDKYYLVDWKSNLIPDGYSGESFLNTVKEHYRLQYDIYYYAFVKWLQKRIKDFNYKKHFGGIYYIYLRGIGNNDKDKDSGIYNIYYDEGMMDEISKTINQLILNMNGLE
jgi:ATP-dependent exoDNAse (exonuclease V) beta subunit